LERALFRREMKWTDDNKISHAVKWMIRGRQATIDKYYRTNKADDPYIAPNTRDEQKEMLTEVENQLTAIDLQILNHDDQAAIYMQFNMAWALGYASPIEATIKTSFAEIKSEHLRHAYREMAEEDIVTYILQQIT
jgi:hypothetical protein